ncbi:D-glycero-beta-D-manno-heptose 1-phosphate adenylyltransferase [Pedobacter sp.]|uniref:D-glycero-beta-D-manno-heptose 1-phosphate adenylyltransferase n=1 Tax=Pedobacter sp. TaxID=1411316 RepID=UPI003D7FC34F
MKKDLLQLIAKFKKHRVLVIGDFMIDAYIEGSCTRVAPEAPVPVIDLNSKHFCLGGAANVAANLKALGCEVMFCTVIGNDEQGARGRLLLEKAGLAEALILADEQRTTSIKTRVSTPRQTLLRFDEGTTSMLTAETESIFLDKIRHAYAQCDALIIADYEKGVITNRVIDYVAKLKTGQRKVIAVDAKRIEAFSVLKPDLIKPNYEEAIKLLGLPFVPNNRKAQLRHQGEELFRLGQAQVTAVTLDNEGSLLFNGVDCVYDSTAPTVMSQQQVSGAGDTYISAALLAILSGANMMQVAELATTSASIGIEKAYTSICSLSELQEVFSHADKLMVSAVVVRDTLKKFKAQGKRIVFTNGCFDILHSGHVSYLHQAKQMGDILVVGLNKDESIRRLKGSNRPVNSLHNRTAVLAALACVDYIIPFGTEKDDTPISLLKIVHPDIFVKGGDYENRLLPETETLRKIGCEIAFLPYVPNQSTTKVISRMDEPARRKLSLLN